MSEEEIDSIKITYKNGDTEWVNDINLIEEYEQLQQENQQLKELVAIETQKSVKRAKQRDLYKSVIDEIRDVIEKMIHIGYTSEEHLTSYFATSEKSEFGCRAKLLLEILDKANKGESNE